MKKLFAIGIVVAVLIGMTIPVFAGKPVPPPTTPMVSVEGTATTLGIGGFGTRVTTIHASISTGAAIGTVEVIKGSLAPWALDVRYLRFDNSWAYLLLFDNGTGKYWYLVVYNGRTNNKDLVSACFTNEYGAYAGVRAWFDAGWKTNVPWELAPGQPLLKVIEGGFTFSP